jgi:hypothetical protein
MEYQEVISEPSALQQSFLQIGYLQLSRYACQAKIDAAACIVLMWSLLGSSFERPKNIAKDYHAVDHVMQFLIARKICDGFCCKRNELKKFRNML